MQQRMQLCNKTALNKVYGFQEKLAVFVIRIFGRGGVT